ncbi:MAG: DUF5615 family PIN-like protein [Blastocatellia bacterium]
MTIRILFDHDVEGFDVFLMTGLRETGWGDELTFEFLRLRDLGLPDDCTDRDIWRRCQQDQLFLITQNRNSDDDTSLQATPDTENTFDSLPVITIPDAEKFKLADYRQQAAYRLVEIILDLDNYLGVGRIFIS